jgi:3-oxoacyl-[acyl-carrier-protein] synthase II
VETVVTGLGTAVSGVARAADLLRPEPPAGHDDPVARLTGRGMRYRDRATRLALCAGRDALADAGLLTEAGAARDGTEIGVVTSTNLGNVDTVCETVTMIAKETYLGTSPMALPATASNVVASWVAITYGLRGANLTLCNGPTSGLDAVHWARLLIAAGRVRAALVVGVEPVNGPVRHLAGDGRALLDGAAALVVESAASARDRGVPALAAVGPYARKGGCSQAIAEVRHGQHAPIGLWCLPERRMPIAPPGLDRAVICDLSATLGGCSGALGVLQAVAAASWLDAGGAGVALATAGAGWQADEDAAAAMILSPVGR